MEKSKIKLNICGTDYVITSEDSYDYVLSIGEDVDKKIKDIFEKSPKVSITMASILAALEYCDSANKLSTSVEGLKEKIKENMHEISQLKALYEQALSEIDTLKNKSFELDEQINRANNLDIQAQKYANEIVDLQDKYNTTYSKLKETEKLTESLTLDHKTELNKLILKNKSISEELRLQSQAYEDKINALNEELLTQKLSQPLSENVTYSESIFEIVNPDTNSFKSVSLSSSV
ncbi:MAG: hypothetical protein RUMPE_00363 [Eubacteriales bacterium SKADARSKE-1]|nr:hypothetical protein [Eubacteriales bacterium SKADARSKE-1]